MDILNWFYKKYHEIDGIYRKSFWILFFFGCILYSFHAYNYIISYHCFHQIEHWNGNLSYLGRFASHWFGFLSANQWLPLWNTMICVFALSFASISIGKLWKIPHTVSAYVLLGAFLLATPHSIAWLTYFSISNYICYLLLPVSLLLLQTKSKIHFSLSIVCVFLSLGVYQKSVDLLAILFLGMFIQDILALQLSHFTIKNNISIIKKYSRILCAFLLSLFAYASAYLYFKSSNVIETNTYMTTTETPLSALLKIPSLFIQTCQQFITPTAHFEIDYRILIILISIFAFLSLFLTFSRESNKKERIIKSIFLVCSFILLIFCTNFSELVHKHSLVKIVRANFFGYVAFALFSIAIVLKSQNRKLHNLGIVCSIALIVLSTLQNLYFQRNLKLAYDVEINRVNRFISRIENEENFDPNQTYHLPMRGNFPSHTLSLYKGTKTTHDLLISQTLWVGNVIQFMEPLIKVCDTWKNIQSLDISSETLEKIKQNLKTAQPWPHKSSVQVIDNVILIIRTQQGLENLIKQIASMTPIARVSSYISLIKKEIGEKGRCKGSINEGFRVRGSKTNPVQMQFQANENINLEIVAELPEKMGASLRCFFRKGDINITINTKDTSQTFNLLPGDINTTVLELKATDIVEILVDKNGEYSTCDEGSIKLNF